MIDVKDIFERGLLFDGRYKLIELLSAEGGSADVWLALDLNTIDSEEDDSTATKVVIKIYRPKNLIDIEGEYQFRSEFKKVFGCHHENIIQPTYFSIFEEAPYLVLPYCPEGSSEQLIGNLKNDDDIWKYIFDVASGLAYLHEHTPQIIHQDIKPANVLIDDNHNYAITDFGISAELGGANVNQSDEQRGTLAYMAPERFIEGTPPKPESDIWAFGATLYELITGVAPYGNDGGSRQNKDTVIPPINIDVSDVIKNLIYSCLSYDIKERPSARQIVDTVLKKRYSRNRKTIAFICLAIIVLIACAFPFIGVKKEMDIDAHLDSLRVSADSIVAGQIVVLKNNKGVPSPENVPEFKKAIVLLNKILKDAPSDYHDIERVTYKSENMEQLIGLIEEYDAVNSLVENARITEMEDSVIKYSLVRENILIKINQLTDILK